MAYGYKDENTPVAVAALDEENVFSGPIEFVYPAASTSPTTGAVVIDGGLGVQGNIYASRVWGCVWNDLADCIEVSEGLELTPGCCYCFDGEKYYKSSKYLEDGIIGIHSDTAGFYMGLQPNKPQLKIGVAGFVLAYVDKEYPVGTPLVCTENGYLTEIKQDDLCRNPYKIVGTFWKKENNETWGPLGQLVDVHDRMWVKIR